MLNILGFRISPGIGATIAIVMIALGITSGVVSLLVAGAVVMAAAAVRFLIWR